MNDIITRPKYDAINSNPDVILCDDLVYENDKYIIRVYTGYISDGGSIPRFSWSILGVTSYDPRCLYAFFVHDFLYQSELLTRKQADDILAEILAIPPSCNAVQRWLIWSHVRAYGWMTYMNHSKETVSEGRKMGEVITKRPLTKAVLI